MEISGASYTLDDVNPDDSHVSVSSIWRSQLPASKATTMQTDASIQHDKIIQAVDRIEQSAQTSDTEASAQHRSTSSTQVAAFLHRVEPLMTEELEKLPLYKDAFVTASLASSKPAGGKQETAERQFTLQNEAATRSELVPTCLSWSCTGQTLAVAYGRYDVTGWCTYPGMMSAWNLARTDLNMNKPEMRVEVSSCLMSCSFHPQHPALIAGGTFNGELFVWELGREGDLEVARSDSSAAILHLEPIVAIHWQHSLAEANKHSNKAQAYRLVTLGADGRVLVWSWHKLQAPIFGYELVYVVPGTERRVVWGGCCMAFDAGRAGDAPIFVVGTEGGRTFKCSMDFTELQAKEFQQKASSSADKLDLRCPIKGMQFEMHAGQVQSVDCSPFQRDLFLSAGRDGLIKLCNMLKPQSLLTLEPSSSGINVVRWSTTRPLVFAAASGDGRVYIYDLTKKSVGGLGLQSPVLALDVSPGGSPVHAMVFNSKEPGLLATSCRDNVQVWKLPSHLLETKQGEASIIKKLAVAETAEDVFLDTDQMG